MGWNWVRQIARFHEVWAITRTKNRAVIESALVQERLANVRWIYFDLPPWACSWKKGRRGIHLYYYLWQVGAYFVAEKLHRQVVFDLVHHVTLGTYWMPSFLALLPVAFAWGPVGGGDSPPSGFWRSFSFRGKVYELLRGFARRIGHLDPFVRFTAQRCALAMVNNHGSLSKVRCLGGKNVIIFSHMGIEPGPQQKEPTTSAVSPPKFVSVGRLLHLKGYDLGLKAFARCHQQFPQWQYWIIGDGPERNRLAKLTQALGIDCSVVFCGWLPTARVQETLAGSDILIHPSLYDSAPSACLEAMAAGLPVICLDVSGPALQVTPDTGIKVPAISPEQVVTDLAAAMNRLAGDPALRAHLGQKGRQRVQEHFSWETKGKYLAELYQALKQGDESAAAFRNFVASEVPPRTTSV